MQNFILIIDNHGEEEIYNINGDSLENALRILFEKYNDNHMFFEIDDHDITYRGNPEHLAIINICGCNYGIYLKNYHFPAM